MVPGMSGGLKKQTSSESLKQAFSSVQFSHSVVSDSLWSHESQHARPPCPTPRVHSNSRPSSWWCHPTISSSVVPFSSCPQSLPASESFPMSQLFAWGGQRTGISALASFLPKNTQGLSPALKSPGHTRRPSFLPYYRQLPRACQAHWGKCQGRSRIRYWLEYWGPGMATDTVWTLLPKSVWNQHIFTV